MIVPEVTFEEVHETFTLSPVLIDDLFMVSVQAGPGGGVTVTCAVQVTVP